MRLVAAALSLALVAPGSLAADADQWQFGGVQPDDSVWSFTPARLPIAQSHLDHYAEVLDLDDQQRAALATLLESLAAQYKQMSVEHSEALADLRARAQAMQDWQTQQLQQGDLSAGFRQETRRLIDGLFDDLRLFLTPDQEERWSAVERDRRRTDTLVQYACFDDESIDLITATEALNISDDQRAALGPILVRYAESLDPVLVERNRKSESLADRIRELQRLQATAYGPSRDADVEDYMKAQQKLQEIQAGLVPDALELRAASERVRDVNRQFMDELTKLIPASAMDDWKKATKPGRRSRNPWESYSRADVLFKLLENLDEMIQMSETRMAFWDSDEANDYALMIRSVEPLSPTQRREIETIHQECTKAMERFERESKPPAQREAEERTALIPTPAGTLTIFRIDPTDTDANPYAYFNRREEDPENAKRRAEIEQNAVDRVRKVLTLNQRAIVAFH